MRTKHAPDLNITRDMHLLPVLRQEKQPPIRAHTRNGARNILRTKRRKNKHQAEKRDNSRGGGPATSAGIGATRGKP